MKKIIIFLICFFISIGSVNAEEITLTKCIDGDTASFQINGKIEKVRFLAIDTPETKHPTKGEEPFGKEASNYTCNALQSSKKIEIEYDENSDKKDKYDRSLGWIFVDGDLLQAKLIENGLAKVAYLYDDYKYTDDLQKLEKDAKKDHKGIWGEYKEDYTKLYIAIEMIIIVIIICISNKNFRKKTLNKAKRKLKNKTSKELNKVINKF